MKFTAVVVYSTIDRFLWSNLRALLNDVTDDVVVVRRTHLLNGEPEDLHEMGVQTITLPAAEWGSSAPMNEARTAGMDAAGHDYVLHLDSDELFEPQRLCEAIASARQPTFFAAESYWRTPNWKLAQSVEVAGLFGKRSDLRCTKGKEREGMAPNILRPRPAAPFMHHFSWCKPLEQMLRKVRSWGHRADRSDWEEQVVKTFTGPMPGHNFVHKGKRQPIACAAPDVFPEGSPFA